MPLWNNLSMLIYRKNAKRIGFNDCNTIETPLSNENRIINFLILYAKQYLFICVKENNVLNFTGLMFHLKFRHDIEKSIFIQNCEFSKLAKLWFSWDHIFYFVLFLFLFVSLVPFCHIHQNKQQYYIIEV